MFLMVTRVLEWWHINYVLGRLWFPCGRFVGIGLLGEWLAWSSRIVTVTANRVRALRDHRRRRLWPARRFARDERRSLCPVPHGAGLPESDRASRGSRSGCAGSRECWNGLRGAACRIDFA